jgi:hypothetical protein
LADIKEHLTRSIGKVYASQRDPAADAAVLDRILRKYNPPD